MQQAFNTVQRTAIEAAVDEANLRRGISDVFRNLARRSQVLLHRQLRLLDGMERRASEPEELEDLFRIDHLTTRMRRHAEGLIILSGEPPGRTWRHPVPLMDVLRAAVAEVEDYTRIRVEARTRAALSGTAVADVIHLIAELAENATVFSPPNTPVKITGDVVGRGFAVEIEDRGLGITEERLAEINRNLAARPRSTCPAATGWACSSPASWPAGTTSRSPCARRPTAAPGHRDHPDQPGREDAREHAGHRRREPRPVRRRRTPRSPTAPAAWRAVPSPSGRRPPRAAALAPRPSGPRGATGTGTAAPDPVPGPSQKREQRLVARAQPEEATPSRPGMPFLADPLSPTRRPPAPSAAPADGLSRPACEEPPNYPSHRSPAGPADQPAGRLGRAGTPVRGPGRPPGARAVLRGRRLRPTALATRTADLDDFGLPTRVRQANLAPQLRRADPADMSEPRRPRRRRPGTRWPRCSAAGTRPDVRCPAAGPRPTERLETGLPPTKRHPGSAAGEAEYEYRRAAGLAP